MRVLAFFCTIDEFRMIWSLLATAKKWRSLTTRFHLSSVFRKMDSISLDPQPAWIFFCGPRAAERVKTRPRWPCQPKTSHFSFLPSHLLSLPSWMVAMLALKFATSSHSPLPKNATLLFRLSHMMLARAAQRVIENPRQMICPVLVERKRERERERERETEVTSPLSR